MNAHLNTTHISGQHSKQTLFKHLFYANRSVAAQHRNFRHKLSHAQNT